MPRFPVTPDVVQAYNFDAVLAKKYFIVCVPTGKALNEISRKFSQFYNISRKLVDSSNEHATFSRLVTARLMDKGSELSLELSVSAELMEY